MLQIYAVQYFMLLASLSLFYDIDVAKNSVVTVIRNEN